MNDLQAEIQKHIVFTTRLIQAEILQKKISKKTEKPHQHSPPQLRYIIQKQTIWEGMVWPGPSPGEVLYVLVQTVVIADMDMDINTKQVVPPCKTPTERR